MRELDPHHINTSKQFHVDNNYLLFVKGKMQFPRIILQIYSPPLKCECVNRRFFESNYRMT